RPTPPATAPLLGGSRGGKAAIARSRDGGLTWSVQTLDGPTIGSVAIDGPSDAWAAPICPTPSGSACNSPSYFHSVDGGTIWTSRPSPSPFLGWLSFAGEGHGWSAPTAGD